MASAGSASLSYFWLRRLHSFSGVFPLGVVIFLYLFVCSSAFQGGEAFDRWMTGFYQLPLFSLFELLFFVVPLFFHVVLGLVISATGRHNMMQYPYYRNWMFFVQRVAGVGAIIFIAYHVWAARVALLLNDQMPHFAHMQRVLAPAWARWFYFIGLLALSFYLAHGFAHMLITWGITVSQRAQRQASILAWGLFALMVVWGFTLMMAFV